MNNSKKLVIPMIIGIIVFWAIIGSLVKFGKYDVAFKVDDTIYHDSDWNDIEDDLYLHTVLFHDYKVMIESRDNVCIIRDASTDEIEKIDVYEIKDIAPPIMMICLVAWVVLLFLRIKYKYK